MNYHLSNNNFNASGQPTHKKKKHTVHGLQD